MSFGATPRVTANADRLPKTLKMVGATLELFFPTIMIDWEYVAAVCIESALDTGEVVVTDDAASINSQYALDLIATLTAKNRNLESANEYLVENFHTLWKSQAVAEAVGDASDSGPSSDVAGVVGRRLPRPDQPCDPPLQDGSHP